MLEILLNQNLNMGFISNNGWSYLHRASRMPSSNHVYPLETDAKSKAELRLQFALKVIQETLLAGVSVNQATDDGITALMQAAESGQVDVVKYLLANKADASLKDKKGKLALDYATQTGERMLSFWKNNSYMHKNYADVILALGGKPDN